MKKIKFSCTNCDAKLRVPTHLAGVSAPCPKCGHTITAPMEIDSAVEEEKAAPRQRPATRSAASAPANAVSTNEGAASTVVAEAPPLTERPQRQEPVPAPPPQARSSVPEPAPQPIVAEPELDAEPEPIVTETFLKPKVEEPSLPAPVLPEAENDVEEAPPAFPETFTPPPPAVPHSEAPPAYEPPPSLEETPVPVPPEGGHDLSTFDLPELPVEEGTYGDELTGPPASEKTQPIRTVERPSNLPPMHTASPTDAGDLPRLDVSLAGDPGNVPGQGKASDKAEGIERTKLRLPQPGEESRRFTPADFIAPESTHAPESPESRPDEGEKDPYSGPEPVDSEESYRIVGDEESYSTPESESVPSEPFEATSEPGLPPFDPVEERSLDDLEIDEDPAPVSKWDPVAPTNPEGTPENLPDEERVDGHLDEGSFEKLFAQQSQEPTPSVSGPQSAPVASGAPVAPEPLVEPAPVPAGVGSVGEQQGTAPESPAPAQSESRSDNDVLDEMFGSSKSTPFRLKKSTLIMLGVCALLGTIAVVIVLVAGSALGFWGDSPTTMEPVTQAPESMKPKEEVVEEPVPGSTAAVADAAPAATDPEAAEKPAEPGGENGSSGSTLSLPGDTESPVRIMDSSVPADSPPAPSNQPENSASVIGTPQPADEPEALSFDERVQNIVNGNGLNADAAAAMPESLNPSSPANGLSAVSEGGASAAGAAASTQIENYNPPEAFAAPGPDDGPLGKTHDLIDAYLRAPDWKTRAKYVYQAESLMPAMEEYYKKWPDRRLDRYSHQLYAMESDVEFGGPYWVYLISQSDDDEGYPFIIRVEDGNLKVDWESHSEFFDQHWVKFQQGGIAVPHTFRVAIERVSDYYGPDRDQFQNLGDYFVYKINPPYGGDDEFMEYAFVKKDTELAARLDKDAGLGDEALAVMLTLDYEQFPHGAQYLVVRDYVSEGWFR